MLQGELSMSMSNDIPLDLATLEVEDDEALSMSMPPYVPQIPTYAPTIDWPTYAPTVEQQEAVEDIVQNSFEEEVETTTTVFNDNEDKLHYVGSNACTPTTKCSTCTGDCDTDSDCSSGLKCFQRDDSTPVPGCAIGGEGDLPVGDYCYDPTVYLFDSTVENDYVGGVLSTADSHLVSEENNNVDDENNMPLVIKLSTDGSDNEYAYYVGFNDEHVTITKRNKVKDEVSLVSLLGLNEEYTFENWRNSGNDLEIGVSEMNTEAQPLGYATVYIFMKTSAEQI